MYYKRQITKPAPLEGYDSLGVDIVGIGKKIGRALLGEDEPKIIVQPAAQPQQQMPSWLLPMMIGMGGLILIIALKK